MSNPLHAYATDNADVNLTSAVTIFSESNAGSVPRWVMLDITVGDGTKNLAAAAETVLTFQVSNGGILGDAITRTIPTSQTRARLQTDPICWINGETLALTCLSDQAGDTDVDVTVVARDVAPLQPATSGRTAAVDASGIIDGQVKGVDSDAITAASIANDAITGDKFAASAVLKIWSQLTAGLAAITGSFGKLIVDNLNVAVDTRSTFDHATHQVTVGTNNDKAGYSLTPTTGLGNQTANITGNLSGSVGSVTGNVGGNVVGSVGSIIGVTFPTNFAALGINASGHVSRVTLVDTTTTNTDMRGTDSALLAASAPANFSDLAIAATTGYVSLGSVGVNAVTGPNDFKADVSGLALQSTLTTVAGYLDTEIAAILEDTGTTLPGLIATAQSDLDILTGTDGVTLATAQLNYAPAKAGDQMDLVNAPNATAVTAIQSGLATLAKLLNYVRLLARKDSAVATDLATELGEINANTGTGTGTYSNNDSQESIRDRGDVAWTTGSGGDATLAKQEEILTSLGLISGNTGPGDTQFPWNIQVDGNPAVGVKVWVSTDNPYTAVNTVAGTLTTDDSGDAPTMFLNADTVYYGWRDSSRYNFTNPVQFRYSTANARWELWNGAAYEEWT